MVKQNSFNNTLVGNLQVALGGDSTGDTYYRDSSGNFVRLAIGSSGQNMTIVGGIPAWITGSSPGGAAGGDLTGTYPNPVVASSAITFGKFQNISTAQFLGRATAASGNVESLSVASAQTLLGLGSAAYVSTGAASGNVPILGAGGFLPSSVIPAISLTTFYGVVANQAARLALTTTNVQPNDFLKQADNGITYVLTATDPTVDANWIPIGDTTIVASMVVSGVFATPLLGTGTANSTTYLRGDQTWATIPSSLTPLIETTGTSATLAINTNYLSSNASLVTFTLPSTAAQGSIIRITGKGAGGWRIAQNASQVIYYGNKATTIGITGRIDATNLRDCVTLLCVTTDNEWQVITGTGNVDVV